MHHPTLRTLSYLKNRPEAREIQIREFFLNFFALSCTNSHLLTDWHSLAFLSRSIGHWVKKSGWQKARFWQRGGCTSFCEKGVTKNVQKIFLSEVLYNFFFHRCPPSICTCSKTQPFCSIMHYSIIRLKPVDSENYALMFSKFFMN